jgi:hypothetical protein
MTEEVTMGDQENQQGARAGTGTADAGAKAVERASNGKSLSQGAEKSALDYLLGAPAPAKYSVKVAFETDDGLKDLRVHFTAMDGRKLDEIEQKNISQATGVMDKASADAELMTEAVTSIEDPVTGKAIGVRSEAFRTVKDGEPPLASAVDALQVRFGSQLGLVAGVASAIREAAGWKADRVGKASRELVDAAGN